MGNVCIFRRIRKRDTLFLKMCAFSLNLANYLGNLQILPLGNVRLSRRIRKNDTLFLNMCISRAHLVNLCAFRWNLVNSRENLQIIPLSHLLFLTPIQTSSWMYFTRGGLSSCTTPLSIFWFSRGTVAFLRKSTNYTLGKRASFSHNSQKFVFFAEI